MTPRMKRALIVLFVLVFLWLTFEAFRVFSNGFTDLTELPGKILKSIKNAALLLWDSLLRILNPLTWIAFGAAIVGQLKRGMGFSIPQAWGIARRANSPAPPTNDGNSFVYNLP